MTGSTHLSEFDFHSNEPDVRQVRIPRGTDGLVSAYEAANARR